MKIESPILRRLGPVPFWRGGKKCLDELQRIYTKAAAAASAAETALFVLRKDAGRHPFHKCGICDLFLLFVPFLMHGVIPGAEKQRLEEKRLSQTLSVARLLPDANESIATN